MKGGTHALAARLDFLWWSFPSMLRRSLWNPFNRLRGGVLVAFSVVSQKSGKTYYLHSRDVILRGGREQTIYFFAQTEKEGVMDELPAGYEVSENPRTGLPLLKKAS